MRIDPAATSWRDMYHTMTGLIVPRPIAWVGTQSETKVYNLAPFSFFTGVTANPPTVCFCSGNRSDGTLKDTARNIMETEAFVINVVSHTLGELMVKTSGEYPPGISEFSEAGLELVPGEVVQAPRVKQAPASIECTLHQTVLIADDDGVVTSRMFIGRIRLIHINDRVIDADGGIDSKRLDAIGRMGGREYARLTERFEIARP